MCVLAEKQVKSEGEIRVTKVGAVKESSFRV